ncbi:MAG: AAA family ATPase, partial [Candidatus Korarchaeota archaeon]|nr:AAA family ATPase [Candidatus Korarchaeota archaeon]
MDGIIREVILENFMSYRYARVPLREGVNLIVGPNGSGKSTILLAISVALGQTYTERGRKLSDLIRRGENFARVTVVIDNSPRNGKRPLPWFRSDEVYFSRYVRGDGQYWHEINGKVVSKAQAQSYLKKIGLDPDNMLIVMHQNMVEEFIYLSSQEKLRLMEEAVGLGEYRLKILHSTEELEVAISEEEKALEMMEKADQTMKYWEEMYEKWRKKQELEEKLEILRRELAWVKVHERERKVAEVEELVLNTRKKIRDMEEKVRYFMRRESEVADQIREIERYILSGSSLPEELGRLREAWMLYSSTLAGRKVAEFHLQILRERLLELEASLKRARRKLEEELAKASELGERIPTERSDEEIQEEIRRVELAIASLGRIPPRVKEAYERYREMYDQIKERARQAMENRRRLSEELERRKRVWRERVREVVEEVGSIYSELITRLGGVGELRLVDMDDLERAGLEIYSDFTGLGLTPLDPYRHSGGERSVTVMCFFLALQRYIRSPFRAVDEFDVHMDPRNRDLIFQMIFELAEEGGQYVV